MLSITRRDDKVFTFYFFDEDGSAIDLTNCSLFVTVKQYEDDTDANAKIADSLTITDATGGIATWTLEPDDTTYLRGIYFWDVQLVDSSDKVYTLIRDRFEVLPDYTIRTSV